MRANAVDAHGQVAVGAKHAIAGRETLLSQPTQYLGAALNALASMLSAVSVDVVDGQELFASFSTAGTDVAIMGQDGVTEPVTANFAPDLHFGLIRAFMHVCGVLPVVGAKLETWLNRLSAARADASRQVAVSSIFLLS